MKPVTRRYPALSKIEAGEMVALDNYGRAYSMESKMILRAPEELDNLFIKITKLIPGARKTVEREIIKLLK